MVSDFKTVLTFQVGPGVLKYIACFKLLADTDAMFNNIFTKL